MDIEVILFILLSLYLSIGVYGEGRCSGNGQCVGGSQSQNPHRDRPGCDKGFVVTGSECTPEDEDECSDVFPICGLNATCHNTPGSYFCTCDPGFRSSKEKFTAEDSGIQCTDINECRESPPHCGLNGACKNTPGSYNCTCPAGFRNRDNNTTAHCEVVDECLAYPNTCGSRGTCKLTQGHRTCICPEGFVNGDNNSTSAPCEDINECEQDPQICGSESEGNCTNTEGSYTCVCRPGHSNYGYEHGRCRELNCDGYQVHGSAGQVGGSLGHLWEKMKKNCEALSKGVVQTAEQGLLEDVFTGTDEFLSSGQNVDKSGQVTGLLTTMEKAMTLIGPQLKQNHTKKKSQHTEAEFAVKRGKTPPTGPVMLSTGNASFYTSWEIAAGSGTYPGFTVAALISYKGLNSTPDSSFQALRGKMEEERKEQMKQKEEQKEEELSLQMVSSVVTACVSNPDTHELDQNISLTFRRNQDNNQSDVLSYVCVSWDKGSWSQRGCVSSSNYTHTVCRCNHLSSFAVLMALYDIEHTFELQLITWIGLAVSLVCLFICILTFGLCRSIKGTRTTIHLHLALCLFLADLIFLCGISRAQKPGCGFVAGLLHYFFLAAFSWILLEGVQLYRMVVLVFHTSLRPVYMMAAGYGAPLAIVIISAMAYPQGYGTDQHCWLSLERGFIWAFFGPVCIIVFLNAFVFIITLWKLAEKLTSLNPELSNLQMIRGFMMAAVAQLCILGGMWMFGCFMFESVAMVYLFTILNSLQGAFIFVMHCLMSKPVREEYAKLLRSICTPGKNRYTEYTSNPSSNSQQPMKTNVSTGQFQF